jgi:SAM-dependent methyltransferase
MNDSINTDSYDSDETKKELDFQAILVGNGKNILVVEFTPTPLSEILVKQNCKVKKVIPKHDNPLDDVYEKFDVIVLGDFLQCVKSPELVLERLRNALNTGGYLVCSITNIGHAYNRIKLLNGEFEYTKDGLINKNFLRLFTFETILHLVSDANYSITKLYREKKDLDLIHNKGLKYFTIPTELIESIKNDPESLVSKYVFSISPASTDSSVIDYLKEFPKSLTTERLKELIRYYKEDLSLAYDKKLEEKDSQISELKKELDENKKNT